MPGTRRHSNIYYVKFKEWAACALPGDSMTIASENNGRIRYIHFYNRGGFLGIPTALVYEDGDMFIQHDFEGPQKRLYLYKLDFTR